MKEKEWKPIVLADAARRGICGQYTELLEKCTSVSDFMRLYRHGAAWALENDVPRLEMLRQYKDERFDLHGVYIDREFNGERLWDRQVYILHNCHGTIRTGLNLEKRNIPIFYLANGCDLIFESANGTYLAHPVDVPVWLFDGSIFTCADPERLHCTIHK